MLQRMPIPSSIVIPQGSCKYLCLNNCLVIILSYLKKNKIKKNNKKIIKKKECPSKQIPNQRMRMPNKSARVSENAQLKNAQTKRL